MEQFLQFAQAVALILGGLGAVGWIANSLYQSQRVDSENAVDHANAESISVATMDRTIHTLNTQMEAQAARHDAELTALRAELVKVKAAADSLEARFDRVLDDLNNERQLGEELAHELERYRFQVAERDERIAQLERLVAAQEIRIGTLEQALRDHDIDPGEINGQPI